MNLEPRKILLYAADPIVLKVTSFRLGLLGMKATAVNCDEQMSAALSEALPDVVIIDLDLQDAVGLKWIEKISCEECTSHIPILCLSSRGDLQEAEDAFKAGARGFLIVPYDPVLFEDKLLEMIEQTEAPPIETKIAEIESAGEVR